MQPSFNLPQYSQAYGGANYTYCGGRGITGPDRKTALISLAMILFPSVLYESWTSPWFGRHYGAGVPAVQATLLALTLYFFMLTACSDPGILPRHCSPLTVYDSVTRECRVRHPPRQQDAVINGSNLRLKYCSTCNIYRPPRSVHCAICDNCVERFDHHCPWLGNCIGSRNYRSFIIFVFFCSILSLFTFITSAVKLACVVSWLKADFSNGEAIFQRIWSYATDAIVLLFYTFILSWFVLALVAYHSYLIATNQTTYEQIKSFFYEGNPWDRGLLGNMADVFCRPVRPRFFDPTKPVLFSIKEPFHFRNAVALANTRDLERSGSHTEQKENKCVSKRNTMLQQAAEEKLDLHLKQRPFNRLPNQAAVVDRVPVVAAHTSSPSFSKIETATSAATSGTISLSPLISTTMTKVTSAPTPIITKTNTSITGAHKTQVVGCGAIGSVAGANAAVFEKAAVGSKNSTPAVEAVITTATVMSSSSNKKNIPTTIEKSNSRNSSSERKSTAATQAVASKFKPSKEAEAALKQPNHKFPGISSQQQQIFQLGNASSFGTATKKSSGKSSPQQLQKKSWKGNEGQAGRPEQEGSNCDNSQLLLQKNLRRTSTASSRNSEALVEEGRLLPMSFNKHFPDSQLTPNSAPQLLTTALVSMQPPESVVSALQSEEDSKNDYFSKNVTTSPACEKTFHKLQANTNTHTNSFIALPRLLAAAERPAAPAASTIAAISTAAAAVVGELFAEDARYCEDALTVADTAADAKIERTLSARKLLSSKVSNDGETAVAAALKLPISAVITANDEEEEAGAAAGFSGVVSDAAASDSCAASKDCALALSTAAATAAHVDALAVGLSTSIAHAENPISIRPKAACSSDAVDTFETKGGAGAAVGATSSASMNVLLADIGCVDAVELRSAAARHSVMQKSNENFSCLPMLSAQVQQHVPRLQYVHRQQQQRQEEQENLLHRDTVFCVSDAQAAVLQPLSSRRILEKEGCSAPRSTYAVAIKDANDRTVREDNAVTAEIHEFRVATHTLAPLPVCEERICSINECTSKSVYEEVQPAVAAAENESFAGIRSWLSSCFIEPLRQKLALSRDNSNSSSNSKTGPLLKALHDTPKKFNCQRRNKSDIAGRYCSGARFCRKVTRDHLYCCGCCCNNLTENDHARAGCCCLPKRSELLLLPKCGAHEDKHVKESCCRVCCRRGSRCRIYPCCIDRRSCWGNPAAVGNVVESSSTFDESEERGSSKSAVGIVADDLHGGTLPAQHNCEKLRGSESTNAYRHCDVVPHREDNIRGITMQSRGSEASGSRTAHEYAESRKTEEKISVSTCFGGVRMRDLVLKCGAIACVLPDDEEEEVETQRATAWPHTSHSVQQQRIFVSDEEAHNLARCSQEHEGKLNDECEKKELFSRWSDGAVFAKTPNEWWYTHGKRKRHVGTAKKSKSDAKGGFVKFG